MSGYNLRAGRVKAQIEKMKALSEAGICAFCPEHFEEYHDSLIEFATEHWTVSKNDYPYEGTKLHLLLVPREHALMLGELSAAARADLAEVLVEIERRWGLESYAVGMRVGDPKRNGGSVDHIHAHVVVGRTDEAGHEPVRFKMSSR